MAQERFVVIDKVEIDREGNTADIIYSDIFDPSVLLEKIKNPETPSDIRDKCSRRIKNAKLMTSEELNKIIPKTS